MEVGTTLAKMVLELRHFLKEKDKQREVVLIGYTVFLQLNHIPSDVSLPSLMSGDRALFYFILIFLLYFLLLWLVSFSQL